MPLQRKHTQGCNLSSDADNLVVRLAVSMDKIRLFNKQIEYRK